MCFVEKGCQYLCYAIINILFLYEYSWKSSATKLRLLLILVILLSTICTIARMCMHQDNPAKTISTGKTSPPQPYYWQTKQSCFQQVNACLMKTTKNRWWAITKNKYRLWNIQLHLGYFEYWVFHSIDMPWSVCKNTKQRKEKYSGFNYFFERSNNWA